MKNILLFCTIVLIINSNHLNAQTYIGASSTPADNAAQAGPTVTVTPVGSMQAGDLVVIYAHYRGTTQTLSISQAGGQTWTTETQQNGTNQRTRVFWCRYNGTWGANPSVTVGTGTSALSVVMYVYRPVNSSNKWFLNIGPSNATATGTSITVTGLTTTAPGSVTMAFWASPATTTWNSLTAGWTKPGSAQYRNTTTGQSHTAAYKIMSSAGATGDVTQTQSSSQATTTSILSWVELPDNDDCASAVTLTPTGICQSIAGNLYQVTQSNPTGSVCGNRYDVWYKFTLPSTAGATFATISVSLTSSPSSLTTTNTYVELFDANSCPASSPIGNCNNISSPRSYLNLTAGGTYYFRVNTTATPTTNPTRWGFDVCVTTFQPSEVGSGRMNEVFRQTILSPPGILADPWEITYGPDSKLWITESKGYKVYRMDPATGAKTTVLDISDNSTFLGADTANIRSRSNNGASAQGGLAGLALHPKFLDPVAPKNYVYVSYVFSLDSASVLDGGCLFFKNKLVRFTYNTTTQQLESPVALCDTLPGSNDHNSQRIIIAPVGGSYYLFYGSGDMGAGQFACRRRVNNAQSIHSYEGKILRFNVDTDNDSPTLSDLANWIPNDNPYNTILGKESAVWSTGVRNNQGLAYDTTLNVLYGSSHGPYSDDEINVIQPFTNYGHPIVIGYASDGNYNGDPTPGTRSSISAGVPWPTSNGVSSISPIGDEMSQKALIDANGEGLYKDPLFSAYAVPNGDTNTAGTIRYIWRYNPSNNNPAPGWPSEAWSGLDLYSNSLIPGWKKSLVAASLKWGRLVRIKLGASGTITMPSNDPINNAGDTISYFGGRNRFRDLTFAPNGKDIYVVMDRSTTTSGPSAQNPVVSACQGCVQKYTFIGYNVNTADNNKSYIPASIEVAQGKNNTCDSVNAVTISAAEGNNNIWVPLTDTSSNIVAEIYAMNQDLGRVTASIYHNANAIRSKSGKKYLDRNITITPETQPASDVKIRLYITKAEYDALQNASGSAVSTISDVKIFKNNDICSSGMSATPAAVLMDFDAESFGANAYVLQGTISSFSTFYFGSNSITTLPLDLITFTGSLQSNNSVLLKWKTENEKNTSYFVVERSTDGNQFSSIGSTAAKGLNSSNTGFDYAHPDMNAANQSSLVLYYRLKIVDIDGSFKYSNVVTVTLNAITGKVIVSPNPTSGIVNVSLATAANEKAKWKLIDNAGRALLQNSVDLKTGNNNWTIDISGLTAGTYYLIISGEKTDQKIKVQKL